MRSVLDRHRQLVRVAHIVDDERAEAHVLERRGVVGVGHGFAVAAADGTVDGRLAAGAVQAQVDAASMR